jgi:hypothetical protein
MILAWIGFVILSIVGLGMIITGLFVCRMVAAFGNGGWLFPISQFAIGGFLLWLAFTYAPFTVIVS